MATRKPIPRQEPALAEGFALGLGLERSKMRCP